MIQKDGHYTYDTKFRLFWSTKKETPVFDEPDRVNAIKNILSDAAKKFSVHNEVIVERMHVEPHVLWMVVSFSPVLSPAEVVKTLMTKSEKDWFNAYPETKSGATGDTLWNPNVFISTLMTDEDIERLRAIRK